MYKLIKVMYFRGVFSLIKRFSKACSVSSLTNMKKVNIIIMCEEFRRCRSIKNKMIFHLLWNNPAFLSFEHFNKGKETFISTYGLVLKRVYTEMRDLYLQVKSTENVTFFWILASKQTLRWKKTVSDLQRRDFKHRNMKIQH